MTSVLRFILGLVLIVGASLESISGGPSWGLVNVSVAHMRSHPRHSSEMVSQAILGTPLRLLTRDGGWWQVESPDGYQGYMIDNSLVAMDSASMDRWRVSPRVVVVSMQEAEVTDTLGARLSDVVNASILCGTVAQDADICTVRFPDGRVGLLPASQVMPLELWAAMPVDIDRILAVGRSMFGTPYLWGGMSSKALDCSGFTRVCYMANALILPRDASQQALTGEDVMPDSLQPGDLLFFGNRDTGRINHVGIYEGGGDFIHSSGRVKRNSLLCDVPGTYYFIKAVRVIGQEGSRGIVRVLDHPWYFSR